MAYKIETEQDFIESLVDQIGSPPGGGGTPGLSQPRSPHASDPIKSASQDIRQRDHDKGMKARTDLRQVKDRIEALTQELHELQRLKVELMRAVTGRM